MSNSSLEQIDEYAVIVMESASKPREPASHQERAGLAGQWPKVAIAVYGGGVEVSAEKFVCACSMVWALASS